MSTHDLKTQAHCPTCACLMSGASNAQAGVHERPEPGDWSVCAYCTTVLVFNADLSVREATEAELREADPKNVAEIRRAQAVFREARLPLFRGGTP